ncbi:MAG: glucosamine-6-phosphate deaminase [Prolixibacteraceae bacterium]|nr:glucosamine-6-phosphate deaminase [Prolixibacteraceae bacterium]
MISSYKIDFLSVRIFKTRQIMGIVAATQTAERIRNLLKINDSISIIFAAAPSQSEFLDALSVQQDIDWGKITAFHMDEYVGLPADAPQGFGNFLRRSIFSKVPFKAVYYLNGNAPDLEQECKRYGDLLDEYQPEIVCMGIGENTHIAFNDPHVADLNDPKTVKVVDLDLQCRRQQVNDGCFDSIGEVPTHALTLTVPTLLRPESVFCIVPGKNKSQAVFHTLTQAISAKYPSTALRNHPNAILFLDKDSAAKTDYCNG